MTHHETNHAPGDPLSTQNTVLSTGASMMQTFGPIKSICAHLNALHVYASDPRRCVEANHYCSHVNEDVRQCIIYDSAEANARLIGVEYMVSPRVFASLHESEKRLWHSHVFEVKSGMLIMPAPTHPLTSALWETAETKEMETIVGWYGKTYHFWQVDRGDPLPLGPPELMVSITAPSQLDLDAAMKARDPKFHVDYMHKAKLREHIPEPALDPAADDVWKEEAR
ncbi:MAG: hypothetical protein M1826_004719 [Phylliscum demangeonii]|nr:MAG: hypothetical protein M1826_004719 [Phylliscum demangeonii]